MNLIPSTAQRRRWFEIVKREGTPSRVPAGQFLTHRFTSLKETLLNIYKSFDPATFRFSFFLFNQVKGNFILALALASNNLCVFSPQGPTEGCGVIPVDGRCVCIDPDPEGYHAAGLTETHTPVRTYNFWNDSLCLIPLKRCRRAY